MIDASTMLGSIMESFPGFVNFLNLFTSLMGVILTGMAIFKFIEFDRLNGNDGGRSLLAPFMYLLSGVALWNLGSSVDTFLETIYGPSTSVQTLLSYSSSGSKLPENTAKMAMLLIMCIRLVGYIAFIKGWLILKRIGSGSQGSDEVFSKALVHLFFGVAAINIVETVNIVSSTVGFGNVLS